MLLHEYEYRIKERRLKRVIAVLAIVCVVSLAMLGINAWRTEQRRQIYVHSIVNNLGNLEVFMWGFYRNIENGENPFDCYRWHSFEYTIREIDNDIRMLEVPRNGRRATTPMSILGWHVTELVREANEGQLEAAKDFLPRRSKELREIVSDLTVEWEEEWWGETVTVTGANVRMSTRQFLSHIDEFTLSVIDERAKQ